MIISVSIFILFYVFLIMEKVDKSILAVSGAVLMIMTRQMTFHQAVEAVDMNVLFLLIGMMTSVGILAETGFFEWIAIYVAKITRGSVVGILVLFLLLTMLLSAFLDNVTTVILIAPLTILLTQLLEINTTLFLVLEALASNIGGTSTLIGDPPNIIIGSKAGISFIEFLIHLGPVIAVIGVIFVFCALFLYRDNLKIAENIRTRVIESYPELAIRDHKRLRNSLIVFSLIFLGFFIHNALEIEPGVIALGGMALMLLFCKSETDQMLKAVEWDTILFFIGLFIMIGALEQNGVIHFLADYLIRFSGTNMLLSIILILWGSAFFSSILDNIPFVIVMIPLTKEMIINFGGTGQGSHPLYWALALGACLGGNGTVIGASANVIISKIGKKNGYEITFANFIKTSAPITVLTLVIATIYLWLSFGLSH